MTTIAIVSLGAIGLVALVIIGYVSKKASADNTIQNAQQIAQKTLDDAQKEAQKIRSRAHSEAQSIADKSRANVEQEVKSRRQSIQDIEKRIYDKEKQISNKESEFENKEKRIKQEFEKVQNLKTKQEELLKDMSVKLENVAGLSKEDAEKQLLDNVEKESRSRAGQLIKKIEEQAKKIANAKAKEIITDAIQRTAVDHVVPATTSVVNLPDDELKGRIIGKEGRNIRTFESITGVDVIIDDTPNAIVLSAFDPIRREIAKLTMQKLVVDGRIHPTRIEEMVEKSKEELSQTIKEKGEAAAEELKLQFHPKIVETLGKLHYRTSYGQNILSHSVEAAHVAGIIAEELDVNVQLAKRGTVLHDIGKALDFEIEGTHTVIGRDLCDKYGESKEILNCIMAHHDEEPPETIEAIIVKIADAISSVRPGARRESVQTYVKRLEKLESLGNSFDGVSKAYAIQAGREIRVMVDPDGVDDDAALKLAQDMAKKIEDELDYPGEVKVSVIRETRAVGIAK